MNSKALEEISSITYHTHRDRFVGNRTEFSPPVSFLLEQKKNKVLRLRLYYPHCSWCELWNKIYPDLYSHIHSSLTHISHSGENQYIWEWYYFDDTEKLRISLENSLLKRLRRIDMGLKRDPAYGLRIYIYLLDII